jgi:hypothetical protein
LVFEEVRRFIGLESLVSGNSYFFCGQKGNVTAS